MWNVIIQIVLQPLDFVLALKLFSWGERSTTFEILGHELRISPSGVFRSYERAVQAGLITAERKVKKKALLEFAIYGAKYAYYVKPGVLTRGMPTAHAAPPLSQTIMSDDTLPVWPDSEGSVRGYAVTPLYKTVPEAAKRDQKLYELLALVDALRIGRARERQLARDELTRRLKT